MELSSARRTEDKELTDLSPPSPPPPSLPDPQAVPLSIPAAFSTTPGGGRFHRVLVHQEPQPATEMVDATNLASCVRIAPGPGCEEREVEPALVTDAFPRNTRCLRFDLRF